MLTWSPSAVDCVQPALQGTIMHYDTCARDLCPTEGSTQRKGPMGKTLVTREKLSKADFKNIPDCDSLPDIDHYDLIRDHAYLYNILTAIKTSVISGELAA
jgi:hypothetical protein